MSKTRTSFSGLAVSTASSCEAACPPVPKSAPRSASSLDKSSVASPETAPVRMRVSSVPSSIALTTPVSGSASSTVAETADIPLL